MKEFLYGVIDRISEGNAVILIDERQKELVVNVESLPFESEEGDWLTLQINNNNEVVYVQKNRKITTVHAGNINETLQRLRARSESKFKK